MAIPRSRCERAKDAYARFSSSTADDHDSGSRRDRKLGNPSDDLPILCWDLEALPTHHLPWAGFGLRRPHWLILNARTLLIGIADDLEKKAPMRLQPHRRSREIGAEIAISRHDHSRSHLAIHIHTPSAEGPGYSPALRRSHEIQTKIAILIQILLLLSTLKRGEHTHASVRVRRH